MTTLTLPRLVGSSLALGLMPLLPGSAIARSLKGPIPLTEAAPLRVELREQAHYRCRGGGEVRASYYSLNDDSLAFVRLILPGGSRQTLPNIVSGSGARYSDDASMVWWVKGDGAFAQTRGSDGSWETSLEDCRLKLP